MDEVIQHLPQGYYTVVGERGVLSQRQRLGIARSLLVEPDVLVFDEATSSLDYESERSIQLAMRSILGKYYNHHCSPAQYGSGRQIRLWFSTRQDCRSGQSC